MRFQVAAVAVCAFLASALAATYESQAALLEQVTGGTNTN